MCGWISVPAGPSVFLYLLPPCLCSFPKDPPPCFSFFLVCASVYVYVCAQASHLPLSLPQDSWDLASGVIFCSHPILAPDLAPCSLQPQLQGLPPGWFPWRPFPGHLILKCPKLSSPPALSRPLCRGPHDDFWGLSLALPSWAPCSVRNSQNYITVLV